MGRGKGMPCARGYTPNSRKGTEVGCLCCQYRVCEPQKLNTCLWLQFEDDRGMTVGQSRQFCSVKEDTAGWFSPQPWICLPLLCSRAPTSSISQTYELRVSNVQPFSSTTTLRCALPSPVPDRERMPATHGRPEVSREDFSAITPMFLAAD